MHGVGSDAAREREWRARGWWPGERLEARYARHVEARPDALAVVDDRGGRLVHRALWDAAGRLAGELAQRGVTPGCPVLLFLPNRVVWQVAFLATLRLRAVPASIPVTSDPRTLAYVADLTGTRTALTAERLGERPIAEVAQAAARECAGGIDVGVLDEAGRAAWTEPAPPARPAPCGVDWLDHVMFTSSTTGMPKAVMHSADTLAALNVAFTERFDLGPERPVLMSSPLGHSVGAIHGARLTLFNGAPLVLQERWDPEAALALVEAHHCDFTAAATPYLKDLVDAAGDGGAATSMRSFLCGGASVPPALMEAAGERFPQTFVTVLWGMTEGGLTTCTRASPRDKLLSTAGVGLPGLETIALAESGEALPTDAEGELAMRGPGVFLGYLAQDDLYRSLLTPDGYFRTGDLARIDADGYVRITGRLKDLIIRGGVNLSPVPTEDVLAAHPAVRAVAVVGVPDERLGERICAVVEAAGPRPDLAALIAFARDRGLAKRQWPEKVCYVDEMPRTAAGKIRKVDLRERLANGELEAGGG